VKTLEAAFNSTIQQEQTEKTEKKEMFSNALQTTAPILNRRTQNSKTQGN
jgi:hypothetical protein